MKKLSFNLLIILPLLLCCNVVSYAQGCVAVPIEERNALIDLFNATSGQNWSDNTNWNTNNPVCEWYGITVSNGTVVKIELSGNNLVGSIPESIKELPNLKFLYLARNQLSFAIPTSVGELSQLKRLDLRENNLNGSIPQSITELLALERLNLSHNSLTGEIPSQIGSMQSLTHLALNTNKLSGKIPQSITELANLEHLYLYENQLSGMIPEGIVNLENLVRLYLHENLLTGTIPENIEQMGKLERIYLSKNNLTGFIPEGIADLDRLTIIGLHGNKLIGSIPSGITNLTKLELLLLHDNLLNGNIPTKISNLTNLKRLNLRQNKLTGTIPEDIGRLYQLTELQLSHNELTGTVPESVEQLVNLTRLNLGANNLSGSLPDFSLLPNLSQIRLSMNKFTFSDLEPNHTYLSNSLDIYTYGGQGKVGKERIERIAIDDDLLLTSNLSSVNNNYQWYKDGVPIPNAFDKEYLIKKVSQLDFGVYYQQAGNALIDNLVLVTNPITVVEALPENVFCISENSPIYTIANLTPSGSNIAWFLDETDSDPLHDTVDIEEIIIDESDTLWWEENNDGTKHASIITINDNTPIGAEVQYFSSTQIPAPTIQDIYTEDEGYEIFWYSNSSYIGGALDENQLLVNGMTYYASLCDSINSSYNIMSSTDSSITAIGSEPGGTIFIKGPSTCSCVLPVRVYIGVLPPAGEAVQHVCAGSTLSELTILTHPGSQLVFYDQAENGTVLSPSTLIEDTVTYYVAQINTLGEESMTRLGVTTYLVNMTPLVVESPQLFYLYDSPTVANLLALGNDSIRWYTQSVGGYQYNSYQTLVDGHTYYAEQIEDGCPGTRVPVQVTVSDEDPPGLLGCDLFKPQVGDRFVINAWVNEREVEPEVIEQIEFNTSEAKDAFVVLLNHLLARLRSTDNTLHDFQDEFVPEVEGVDFNLILPFLKDLEIDEKVLTVYDFKKRFDSYGRTIGFQFYLTKSRAYKFKYLTPLVNYTDYTEDPPADIPGHYHYPILDNQDSLMLEFTNVYVDENDEEKFMIVSDFHQQGAPAHSATNIIGGSSQDCLNPTATFYAYNEVAHQQAMDYENSKIVIEFNDPEGNLLTTETVELTPQGVIIEDWQKVSSDFRIPINAGQMVLSMINTSDSKISYFDDLRILPFAGSMKSFVYHPETQRIMAELDENNYATFYEYDKEGGLIRVKKETERGIYTIQETRSGKIKK